MNVFGQLICVLLIVGVIARYFWWLVATIAIIWLARGAVRSFKLEEQRRAGLLARMDQQHAWCMAGDERGTYGDHYRLVQRTQICGN